MPRTSKNTPAAHALLRMQGMLRYLQLQCLSRRFRRVAVLKEKKRVLRLLLRSLSTKITPTIGSLQWFPGARASRFKISSSL